MSALAAVLELLEERASRPLERARALPGVCYTSEELYAHEVEHIFRKEWMCVARAEQLPEPGDWIALDQLHALSRVCAHRSQDLLNDTDDRRGNIARFTCPYHAWSFRLDGSCIGAPDMGGSEEFDPASCALGRFPLAVWNGFVFVNLEPGAAPLANVTAGLDAVLGDVDLREWRVARTLPWGEQPANWKVVIDNGVECYHHMGTHHATLEPVYPHASVDVEVSRDDHWIAGHMVISEAFAAGETNGHRRHPLFFTAPAAGMSAFQQSETLVTGIFPMFFLAVSPDFCTWFQWYPTGPHSHTVDLHLMVPPDAYAQPDREAVLDQIASVLNTIQAEDVRNNVGVQRSLHSQFATGGPLSRLEYPLWRFQRYLAQHLVTGASSSGRRSR
jgi:phenylpropionate dioxygenase-like ring-hydroxylating dioxygenase large terminal subunit